MRGGRMIDVTSSSKDSFSDGFLRRLHTRSHHKVKSVQPLPHNANDSLRWSAFRLGWSFHRLHAAHRNQSCCRLQRRVCVVSRNRRIFLEQMMRALRSEEHTSALQSLM